MYDIIFKSVALKIGLSYFTLQLDGSTKMHKLFKIARRTYRLIGIENLHRATLSTYLCYRTSYHYQ